MTFIWSFSGLRSTIFDLYDFPANPFFTEHYRLYLKTMSRVLRELVGKNASKFMLKLANMEAAAGKPSIDVTLTAEIIESAARAPVLFGLDHHDTRVIELAANAVREYKIDDTWLKTSQQKSGKSLSVYLATVIERYSPSTEVPVIKGASLRRIFKQIPAKKTMKVMGYRSYESFLKRVDIEVAAIVSQRVEGLTWHRAFYKKVVSCTQADIDMKKPHFVAVEQEWVGKYPITNAQIVGAVGVVPLDGQVSSHIVWLSRLSDALFHLQRRGVYVQLLRFHTNIATQLGHVCYMPPEAIKVASRKADWPVLYRAMASCVVPGNDALLGTKDVAWQQNLQWLGSLHPRFKRWVETLRTGRSDASGNISLNISDIAENVASKVPFNEYNTTYLAVEIETELAARYLLHSSRHEIETIMMGEDLN